MKFGVLTIPNLILMERTPAVKMFFMWQLVGWGGVLFYNTCLKIKEGSETPGKNVNQLILS